MALPKDTEARASNGRLWANAVMAGLVGLLISGCSAASVMNGVLGSAKNWCRHQGTNCHVDDRPPHAR